MRRFAIALALAPIVLLALAGTPLAAERVTLLPAAAGDLAGARTLIAPGPAGVVATAPGAQAPAAVSWPLAADSALALDARPFVAESREHWFRVGAAELAAGVALEISSPGAVVRISPLGAAARADAASWAIDPTALALADRDGRSHPAAEAFSALADEAGLEVAGADFPPGTAAFRIRAELGVGPFTLRAPALAGGRGRYLVHVLEPASARTLALAADRPAYLAGDRLRIEVGLAERGSPLQLSSVLGTVRTPAGTSLPVSFVRSNGGRYRAELALAADFAAAPGALWEVEVGARGWAAGAPVRRSARTAFAVALPTARLSGAVAPVAGRDGVGIAVGIETAAAGRYELRGVLYGTDRQGELVPAAVAHSADWLAVGAGELALAVDGKPLAESGLTAPWEIRDLRLIDSGRLGLLERRLRGARVEP